MFHAPSRWSVGNKANLDGLVREEDNHFRPGLQSDPISITHNNIEKENPVSGPSGIVEREEIFCDNQISSPILVEAQKICSPRIKAAIPSNSVTPEHATQRMKEISDDRMREPLQNKKGKKAYGYAKHSKAMEAREKWSSFVLDLESSADREVETHITRDVQKKSKQEIANEKRWKEAAKTCKVWKKLGLTSIVEEGRMINELEKLDRSNRGVSGEARVNNDVCNQ